MDWLVQYRYVGSFAWVTGEPLSFTDWNYMEPNNENGNATVVNETYVHTWCCAQ